MPQPIQQTPILPWEITDIIIDYLRNDEQTLGVCSSVCSEWLIRARHHTFSTVQLWPWRVAEFLDLAQSQNCTFTNHIKRLELDVGGKPPRSDNRHEKPSSSSGHVRFNDTLAHSHLPCLSRLHTLHIRNVNWTAFSPSQQAILRNRFAKFSQLRRLELANVTFHDLREVVRIVESVPKLDQLGLNVVFTKYLEHTLVSAAQLRLPDRLATIELGSDDSIPVVLTCVNQHERLAHVRTVKVQNMREKHLDYMRVFLQKSAPTIEHIALDFSRYELEIGDRESQRLADAINFSQLGQLRTLRISGLNFARTPGKGVEESTPSLLSTIESSFLEWVELDFTVECIEDLERFDWAQLERVLLAHHFFGMASVRVRAEVGPGVDFQSCEARIQQLLPVLNERKVLNVNVWRMFKSAPEEGNPVEDVSSKL